MGFLTYIAITIVVIAGLTVVMISIKNRLAKNRSLAIIENAKTGKLKVDKLNEELSYRVGKPFRLSSGINMKDADLVFHKLNEIVLPGAKILAVINLQENKLLIVTEIFFEDQVTVTFGTNADIKKVFSTLFILEPIKSGEEFVLRSSLYENKDTLHVRERFRENFINTFM